MLNKLLKFLFKFEILWFGKKSSPINFYILQMAVFAYSALRISSRSPQVYGLIPKELFSYPREFYFENWPIPVSYFLTGQFIYELIPRPDVHSLHILQIFMVAVALLGLIGVLPRLMASLLFISYLHITGFIHATNAELDAGDLLLSALLILCLVPNRLFYRLGKKPELESNTKFTAPLFLFLLTVGCYYSFSGLQKLIQDGLLWPFKLRLDNYASYCLEEALFVSYRYKIPELCNLMTSKWLSHVSGVITIIAETGFISVLFLPNLRVFFCLSMIVMHTIIFYTHGINFMGNSVLILCCLDWERIYSFLKMKLNTKFKSSTGITSGQNENLTLVNR